MKKKNERGITLIALVITIIILLILAGVTIATLTGENGVLTKATNAKEQTEISGYYEKIELIRNELRLKNENYKNPTLTQLRDEFKNNQTNWVASSEIQQVEGTEKLVLTTKEGYIFYITETSTEYKGKGKVVDTTALNKKEALGLEIVGDASNGKLVKITDLSSVDYYKIEYKIDSVEGEWTEIQSGQTVEVGYSSTINARLVYGSNKGTIVSLSIDASNPTLVAKNVDTSYYIRKTSTTFDNLFDITWGSDGSGSIEYSIAGNLKFKNTNFSNTEINNLSELELGNYTITCKVISPSNKTATANKTVRVTTLASTTVIDENQEKVASAIYSGYDLAYFRDLVNNGKQTSINGKLMNSFNLSNVCGASIESWEPIGTTKYSGIFDGGNNTVDYLYINTTNDAQGLFGIIENASIRGIVIGENSSVTGNNQVGGIVGNGTNSNISKCGNNATVTSKKESAGGIVGINLNVQISETYNKADIRGEARIAGICGFVKESSSSVLINYSYNTGNIEGGYYIGGIVGNGNDNAKINNCYNNGIIKGKNNATSDNNVYMGGIAGRLRAYGEANYCYNLGKIDNIGTGLGVGGIVGVNYANSSSGFVLERSSKIENSYNSGNIESKGEQVGGICGINGLYCYVKNSYIEMNTTVKYNAISATENVGSANNYLGKIVGLNNADNSNISNVGISSSMPTVYKVVNSLNDGESEYWSKSNVNEPQLLWEIKT